MMGVWVLKFLSGFNIFNAATLGKVLWVVVLSGALVGAYHKLFVTPTHSHTERNSFQGATIQQYVARQEVGKQERRL